MGTDLLVTVLSRVEYTVPSFPVTTTRLCEIRYQFVNVNVNKQIYDGYTRDCPGLVWPSLSILKVCSNYTKAFTIGVEEFDRCLPIAGKTLYKGDSGELVLVFWKWNWQDSALLVPEDNESAEDSDEGCCCSNDGEQDNTD